MTSEDSDTVIKTRDKGAFPSGDGVVSQARSGEREQSTMIHDTFLFFF